MMIWKEFGRKLLYIHWVLPRNIAAGNEENQ
jgi:hypothetical protein